MARVFQYGQIWGGFFLSFLCLGLNFTLTIRETSVMEMLNRWLQLFEQLVPLCISLLMSAPTQHLHQHLGDRTQSTENTNFLFLPWWVRVTV